MNNLFQVIIVDKENYEGRELTEDEKLHMAIAVEEVKDINDIKVFGGLHFIVGKNNYLVDNDVLKYPEALVKCLVYATNECMLLNAAIHFVADLESIGDGELQIKVNN